MRPTSSYFVCYTARSGSTLLCDALSSTGVAGKPDEWFYRIGETPPATLQDPSKRFLDEMLEHAFTSATTPDGLFGSKLLWPELEYLGGALRRSAADSRLSTAELMSREFPNPRYIWITRRDKVRQAVSYVRAAQSGVWTPAKYNYDPRPLPLVFNHQLVASPLRRIVLQEAAWAQYFEQSGIVPLTVVYEDLVLAYEQTLRRTLDFLGIPLPEDYTFPAPRLKKLADTLSDEWVECFSRADNRRYVRQTIANLPATLRNRTLREAYVKPRLKNQLDKAPAIVRRLRRRLSI